MANTSRHGNSTKYYSLLFLALIPLFGILGLQQGTFPGVGGSPDLSNGDMAWMLTASALVLLMTPGLSFFYGGFVQKKNLVSTMFQSFVCLGLISILWVVVGFSLAFGDSLGGFIGDPRTFFMFKNVGRLPDPKFAPTIPLALFALFQLKFAIITPALITGAFAERINFKSYLLYTAQFSIFIYSPLAHMTWHPDGFLRQMGLRLGNFTGDENVSTG
jgi:Amt family ammonium transporter